ncbi:ABC transporter ATP-binding protein [Methylocapsa polymorpha]|uniref:ABC transporter ATP-binding protein n=1 Tax=Methylocapsa polymorpha TaxID=3080828 RepID=A0ABZ0HNS4_9HYPH|nr:ABC transporter ATP-binding protein [Methylocapsa sp. RX1]
MILRASSLRKRYGGEAGCEAVSQGDLTVEEGEFISIVGRSGSGKSTLLAMIGGLMKPSEGQVFLEGKDIWALPEKALADLRCRRMGFVFQFFSLLPSLRAVDNVALPALLGRSMAPEDAYERAQNLLARVGLEERMFAYPGEMSGGEQRRVVIARALINAPRLLLADEPTSDLDEDTECDIVALLEQLRREASFGMIVVTHNLDLAKRADRMFQMKQGRLYATALPEVAIRPAQPRRFDPPRAAVPVNNARHVDGARAIGKLGATLWAAAGRAFVVAGLVFTLVLLGNYSLARYQRYQAALRRERLAALEELATSTLKSEIDSVTRMGDGHYEVTIYLENTGGDKPIYVMTPSVQGFIQVGSDWQEAPLTPVAESVASVLKVTGKQLYRFVLDARVDKFTELLPHYMHVRLTNNMLISPESAPKDELFQRNDSYFIYLKPDNVDDATITKDVRFAGQPPLWIWMPPH